MGKFLSNDVLDALLNEIADNADRIHFCVGEPDNYADITNHTKGFVTVTPGAGNGDYVIAAGVVSGRRLQVTEQTLTPTGDGVIDHVVAADSVNSVIKAITTASFTVKDAVNKTIPQFDLVEVRSPE